MGNVAVAKENKETDLNGHLKDSVRRMTRAVSSTMKIQNEREKDRSPSRDSNRSSTGDVKGVKGKDPKV